MPIFLLRHDVKTEVDLFPLNTSLITGFKVLAAHTHQGGAPRGLLQEVRVFYQVFITSQRWQSVHHGKKPKL